MKKDVVIIIAEDDPGHATLIRKNLKRVGIINDFIHITDGKQTLDFLFGTGGGASRLKDTPYLLLLDIKMPKIDGVEVLRRIKQDEELRKMPVIMITTTDDPKEVDKCHRIGCSTYLTKPVDYDRFIKAIRQLGLFLQVVEVPKLGGGGK